MDNSEVCRDLPMMLIMTMAGSATRRRIRITTTAYHNLFVMAITVVTGTMSSLRCRHGQPVMPITP